MNLATVISLAVETFTIVDVPFFGLYSWIALSMIVLALAAWIVLGFFDGEPVFAIFTGLIVAGLVSMFVVFMPSDIGMKDEISRLKVEQLAKLGYSNISYESGDFTASDSDGQYVRGLVEWDQDKYQVLLFDK